MALHSDASEGAILNYLAGTSDYGDAGALRRIAALVGAMQGDGSPEGAVTATVGALYVDETTPGLYIKETGSGNTGWTGIGSVGSALTYRGGYNASTNSPDLDTAPSGVSLGDVYVVTAAGTFFTAAVEVGDLLFAEVNDADAESEWTIVQANLTAATIKSQYESNSDTNAFTDAEQTKLAGIATGYAAKTTTYTVTTADKIINATSGTFTITLPTAVSDTGREFIIKNSGSGVVTVDGATTETIDGAATVDLNQYDSITIVSDGANWIVI